MPHDCVAFFYLLIFESIAIQNTILTPYFFESFNQPYQVSIAEIKKYMKEKLILIQ